VPARGIGQRWRLREELLGEELTGENGGGGGALLFGATERKNGVALSLWCEWERSRGNGSVSASSKREGAEWRREEGMERHAGQRRRRPMALSAAGIEASTSPIGEGSSTE